MCDDKDNESERCERDTPSPSDGGMMSDGQNPTKENIPFSIWEMACGEARTGMTRGDGGPFGAVIIREGRVIGSSHNQVLLLNDPTAHAEVMAIREACRTLGTYDLSGCELYTTCYPCPMCMGAVQWARIGVVRYGSTRQEAAAGGFDDARFWSDIRHPDSMALVSLEHHDSEACRELFREWHLKTDRRMY